MALGYFMLLAAKKGRDQRFIAGLDVGAVP